MPEESHERNNFDHEQVTENINWYLNNLDLEEQRHSTGTEKRYAQTNPFCGLPESFRHNVMACVAEFVGTFMFLLMAFIIEQVANSDLRLSMQGSNPTQLLLVAFGFGFSLTVNVYCFYKVSGVHFNPAVTLTLTLIRAVGPVRAIVNVITQFVAAITAAAAADALTPGPTDFNPDLNGEVNKSQGLFIEMFGTGLVCMTAGLMPFERHRQAFMSPIAIGLSLFISHLVTFYYTGAGLNPARVLGSNVSSTQFHHYAWIYFLGPSMASMFVVFLYYLLKILHGKEAASGR